MSLIDMMARDIPRLHDADHGAVTMVYEEPDGTSVTLTANAWDAMTEQRDVRGIITFVTIRNVTFAVEDLSSINLRATVQIGDMDYAITRILYQDDYVITLELQRHELHEHSRPGYRRQ